MAFGDTFLNRPGRLPTRTDEAWGERAMSVRLPGGTYLVEGLDVSQAEALARRFTDDGPSGALQGTRVRRRSSTPAPEKTESTLPPLTPPNKTDRLLGRDTPLRVRVRRADPALFREVDTRGWEYALDFAFAADGLRLVGLGLAAEVSWRGDGAATLWMARGEPEHALGHVENLLRVLTAYRLLAAGGAMIHCAAVAWGGRAVLAVGRSGAGKSTFSRLAAAGGALVLSDDLAAVRAAADGWWIDPLPFGGDFGPPTAPSSPLPLGGVLRLEQAPRDELRPLGAAEAVALLLACAPMVNQDPHRRDELLAVLTRLLTSTQAPPIHALGFRRDGDCWDLVRDTLLSSAEVPAR